MNINFHIFLPIYTSVSLCYFIVFNVKFLVKNEVFILLSLFLNVLFFLMLFWMQFSVSFLNSLLLVWNTIDFWLLSLYRVTSWNSLLYFYCGFLRIFYIMGSFHLQIRTVLLLPSTLIFSTFLSPYLPPRTPSTMLNRSGRNGHPCLTPFRRRLSVFHCYAWW